jgi:hypothetical protein
MIISQIDNIEFFGGQLNRFRNRLFRFFALYSRYPTVKHTFTIHPCHCIVRRGIPSVVRTRIHFLRGCCVNLQLFLMYDRLCLLQFPPWVCVQTPILKLIIFPRTLTRIHFIAHLSRMLTHKSSFTSEGTVMLDKNSSTPSISVYGLGSGCSTGILFIGTIVAWSWGSSLHL